MSLKYKIPLITLLALGLPALTEHGINQMVFLPSFAQLERQDASKNMDRCIQALDRELNQLDLMCYDWSAWDDMCKFTVDRDEEFRKSNLCTDAMQTNRLNVLFVFSNSGELIWGTIYDLKSRHEITDPAVLQSFLKLCPQLQKHAKIESDYRGVIANPRCPILIASKPIITSKRQGPIRGTLVMGRFLQEDLVKAFCEQTRLSLQIWPMYAQLRDAERQGAEQVLKTGGPYIKEQGQNDLSVYSQVNDLWGNPTLLLKIDLPRSITKTGRDSASLAMAAFTVAGIITLCFVLFWSHRVLVHPLTRLTRFTLDIRKTKNLSQRVILKNRDEIGSLAESFNCMVEKISQSQELLERRVAERTAELAASNEELRKASKAKSDFLARMSHEMRTPMNGIMGLTQLMMDTGLSDEQREYLKIVDDSANSLLQIIDQTLDFSKIEAGKMELRNRPFQVRPVMENCLKALKLRAEEKGLVLETIIAPQTPQQLCGDDSRLRQVIINLVANAVKFTESGRITVTVEPAGQQDMLHFKVTDTGIGVPPDKRELIFLPFEQADSSMTRQYGGAGLGLAICKDIIELMGGHIWLAQTNRGSCFEFTARFEAVSQPPVAAAPPRQPRESDKTKSLSVLVVEDNPVNRLVATKLLKKAGHQVHLAEDGQQALNAFSSQSFDVILMDIQMPIMDGLTATAEIRRIEDSSTDRRQTFICAMTAHALDADRQQCLSVGMHDYLTKPINARQLTELLEKVWCRIDSGEDFSDWHAQGCTGAKS